MAFRVQGLTFQGIGAGKAPEADDIVWCVHVRSRSLLRRRIFFLEL
jgi:hypothetical protein